ncbi:hypothetical protein AMS68_001487 [Peltaster fructicola]|uniref:Uncharacterized protein n=1 Tax=Peltaster fructicola TaxID=286661 RepID=A0A6H0XNA5_9PEZI|nr:hypothetical protein AMS68_001487 [Peltaster fructicola]
MLSFHSAFALRTASLPTQPSLYLKRSLTIRQLNERRDGRQRVVILGSGWGGYTLARRLDPKDFQIVIVSPRSYFVFTPLLASTSVGTLEFRTALESLRSRGSRYEYYQGRAESIDFANNRVVIRETVRDPNVGLIKAYANVEKDERALTSRIEESRGDVFPLSYDKLVLAVGSYSQTFGIPGVTEHAYFLKDIQDARRIRTKILSCFETAALPTTPVQTQKDLLHFAITGGGPTGCEFSAELLDIIREDLQRFYPQLMQHVRITLFDVSPKILSMFDEKLGSYALDHFGREGVTIKTNHKILGLEQGLPVVADVEAPNATVQASGYTLTVQNGDNIPRSMGCGMVVWSTGLMANPFVANRLNDSFAVPAGRVKSLAEDNLDARRLTACKVQRNLRSGSIVTDNHLRIQMKSESGSTATLQDVFAIGDCAACADRQYPATAQVASQQATWLAKHLNQGDIDSVKQGFSFENLGIMAYLGAFNGIVQLGKGRSVSGRAAFWMWRSVYLTKAMSWRNRLLIPIYWTINSIFGRDISRF